MTRLLATVVCSAALLLSCALPVACADNSTDPTDATGTSTTSSSSSSSSTGTGGAGGTGGASACLACDGPNNYAVPSDGSIEEASGLTASLNHPGAYYVHNDSGDSARFFATNDAGADLGTYQVTNVTANDWEAMGRGPCADNTQSCLYIADTGDNKEERATYSIVRVSEPAALTRGTHQVTGEVFRFVYEDAPRNCEAILVHPTTGRISLITKSARQTRIYELPLPLDSASTMTATFVGEATVPGLIKLVTDAAMHPSAKGILIRTYQAVAYYPLFDGETVAQALARESCTMPTPVELQGEAITFTLDGNGYRTLGEGEDQQLKGATCTP